MTVPESPPRYIYRILEPLILASASPRRSELLKSVGLCFDVLPSGIEETAIRRGSPDALAKGWASEKTLAVARLQPKSWVLGADTVVALGETIFGKPENRQEATSMLAQLSGKAHRVITGVCLMRYDRHFERVQAVETQVQFKRLSKEEIEAYVITGEPLDKAGAYGIQGMAAGFVRSIRGSYTNVVGLPLCETLECLLEQRVVGLASIKPE